MAVLVGLVAAAGAATATMGAPAATGKGEHLRYRASWNGVPVANADLLIVPAPGAGRKAVELRGRAETNDVLDLLWRMRDSFEATVATDPPAPERFVLRQHENSSRRVTEVARDATRTRLIGEKRRSGRAPRTATVGLHRRLHDPASLAYLISGLPEDLKSPQSYEVFTGTKTYELTVTPGGTETTEQLGRSWRALKLHLALRLVAKGEKLGAGPPLQPRVQEADLWISSGPVRLPLRMQAPTFWGWVTVELIGRGPVASEKLKT